MTNNNTLGLSPTNLSSEYIDINKTDITIATELYASVNSKEYQVFLDRFRRKDGENYTSNEKAIIKVVIVMMIRTVLKPIL